MNRRYVSPDTVRLESAEGTQVPYFVEKRTFGLRTECSSRFEKNSTANSYIQLWNGDVQVLTESLGYIRHAASQMLVALTDA
jgi:hypothetical protein